MTTFAVLPVKKLTECKQRLSEDLTIQERTDLMEEMFVDTVVAAVNCEALAGTIVVSDDLKIRELASRYGAEAIPEGELGSHSAAALVGIKASMSRGANRVALLACDCPLIEIESVEKLLALGKGDICSVVIAPDRHGTGTNALVLSPPEVIEPAFGEGSFEEHTSRAYAASASVHIARIPELEHDVDTAEDLAAIAQLTTCSTP